MDSNDIWLRNYFYFANYISVAMLYLKENQLLSSKLTKENIKERILGHWGTVPGINLVYGGLNLLAKTEKLKITLVNGPGHGAPAILAGLFIEGTLSEYYKQRYPFDTNGLSNLIRDFSWPGGFPSHTSPMLPGTIHEGGELGYSLATAFGVAFDNPDNLVACIVGDGEAESATLSASWQSFKFLNPVNDGSVLPILHLNGYKISGPTIFGTMSNQELISYFSGMGLYPIIVDQYDRETEIFSEFIASLRIAIDLIRKIKSSWSEYNLQKPKWPVLILKTKKGWSGPKFNKHERIEDNNLSHGIPLQNCKKDDTEFILLKDWLESYNIHAFLSGSTISHEVLQNIPENEFKIGKSPLVNTDFEPLKLPEIDNEAVRVPKKGGRIEKRMEFMAEYLRNIFLENYPVNNFRIFSPDESESNALSAMFSATDRIYLWPVRDWDKHYSADGHIMEILSENVLQGWLSGYLLSGRHGILISYEAFLNVISSQIDQHIKFLNHSEKVNWRNNVGSLNLVATSTLWRQEHNGFTHQNPTLINSLLTKYNKNVKIYFPCDVNSMLSTLEFCLSSTNGVNLIVVGKRDMPQWLDLKEAKQHIEDGISIWSWCSDDDPDVVLASLGDYQTNETLKAIEILRSIISDIKIRYININQISQFSIGNKINLLDSTDHMQNFFTTNRDVIINFHGYPTAMQQLLFGKIDSYRVKILGYQEIGTTTTPLDMQVLNGTSRFHIAIEAIKSLKKLKKEKEGELDGLILDLQKDIEKNNESILEGGIDSVSLV